MKIKLIYLVLVEVLVFASIINLGSAAEINLKNIIENVTSANGYKYLTKDNIGNSMDTAKIIDNPEGGYLAVYHTGTTVKLASSSDILVWTFIKDLETNATQPTIFNLTNGGFLVAFEKHRGGGHVQINYYTNIDHLKNGITDRYFFAPRTLSNCNEGTPNIYNVYISNSSTNITNSIIDIGFHYHREKAGGGCDVDRQARGTLRNFSEWSSEIDSDSNNAIEPLIDPSRNIGDRDSIIYEGNRYNIIEANGGPGNSNFSDWRIFLYNWSDKKAFKLNISTHKGSTAFANPTISKIKDPNGTGNSSIVVTLFIPSEGAKKGETGELVYYKEYKYKEDMDITESITNSKTDLKNISFDYYINWLKTKLYTSFGKW